MARHARGTQKALLYIAVMLPLWSSYLVRLYAWKLLLARKARSRGWRSSCTSTWLLDALLSLPAIGGPSLSFSTHRHLHRLRLHVAAVHGAADHGVDRAHSRLAASKPRATSAPTRRTTFRRVILPLAMPGVAAGSIFTFSLTLGDYIIPQVIGDSTLYIGQVVYRQQGVAGNIPFAAAFSLVPIVVIGVYLWLAKRQGAFDAL